MMYWNGDWSWGGWLAMTVAMILVWGIVAWVVVVLLRTLADRGTGPPSGSEAPQDALAGRLARGEISIEEYERLLEVLKRDDRG